MRRTFLYLPVCLALLAALVLPQSTGDVSTSVMAPRLLSALEGEGPWPVWVFFVDKGVEGADLEAALVALEPGKAIRIIVK